MEARINNGKDNFLYCNVDCEISNYQSSYNSSQEAFQSIRGEIIEDCEKRGYEEYEIEKVLNHYEILFNNASGNWKNEC
jgi:hypothetical protein